MNQQIESSQQTPVQQRRVTGVELATFVLLKSLRAWRYAVERGLEEGPTKKLNLILVRHFTGVIKAWETWRLEMRPPPQSTPKPKPKSEPKQSTLTAPAGVSLLERHQYNQKQKLKHQGGKQ